MHFRTPAKIVLGTLFVIFSASSWSAEWECKDFCRQATGEVVASPYRCTSFGGSPTFVALNEATYDFLNSLPQRGRFCFKGTQRWFRDGAVIFIFEAQHEQAGAR